MNALALASLFCTVGFSGDLVAPASVTATPATSISQCIVIDETEGVLGQIDAEMKSFDLITDTEKLSLRVNEKTVYTMNGKEAKKADALKTGSAARVVHNDGVASEVHVTTEA